VRALAASFADLEPAALQHVLVTEYRPGAGIGWHRDKAVFGQVVGISLLAKCVLRFRRKKTVSDRDPVNLDTPPVERGRSTPKAASKRVKAKQQWERVSVLVEPRSAYLLSGPARMVWEHSISRVEEHRYSITFRNMRED
jgi:alkylated DNA repair dioxygenase AlkB